MRKKDGNAIVTGGIYSQLHVEMQKVLQLTPHMLLNGNWYGAIDSNGIAWCAAL